MKFEGVFELFSECFQNIFRIRKKTQKKLNKETQ